MADTKISDLPAGFTLDGTEAIPAVQAGVTSQTTPAAIKTYVETGGTVTASDPVLDLTQTFNNAAVVLTAERTNITDTASAARSLLRDWQVGGVSKVSIEKSGQLNLAYTAVGTGTGQIALNSSSGTGVALTSAGNGGGFFVSSLADGLSQLFIRPNATDFAANGRIGFTNAANTATTTIDLVVQRDAAGYLALRNGAAEPHGLRAYESYTDASNYRRIALNTNVAGDWVQIAAESAGTPGLNTGIALTPTGTGAISAHVPDSTAAGGNARGTNAVDWQNSRGLNSQVASGSLSVVAGGSNNTASATNSTVSGGLGNTAASANAAIAGGTNNSASGNQSFVGGGTTNSASGASSVIAGGSTNTASGVISWIPGGFAADTRGLFGAGAYASGKRSANGDAQVILQPVRRTTTDATPVSLATDGTPAATTVMVLPANSTLVVTATVGARDTSGNSAGWIAQALFKRDGSNNTTRLGSTNLVPIGTPDAALATATLDLVANDTLESAEIQVTGVAATTIYWVGELKCVQIA